MPKLEVAGGELYYEEAGRGTEIVLLHGFPLDSRVWADVKAALSEKFRVIAPDLTGFGQSTAAAPFTMESLAEDLYQLLDKIDAGPQVFVGLSMGGYVALTYAKLHLSSLRGLVLVDSRVEGDTAEGKIGREKMAELARTGGSSAVAEQMFPKMLAPYAEAHLAAQLNAIMNECPSATIENACLAMRDRDDFSASLPKWGLPVQIIVGQHDAITPVAGARKLHDSVPRSRLAVISDAGHMSPFEKPDAVAIAIEQFVESVTV